MKRIVSSLVYREIEADRLEVIRPMWEKLKAFHVTLSPHFASRRAERSFDRRREEFLAKSASGGLKVDVACVEGQDVPVGFCVTSVTSNGTGEIDSLFVEEDYRGNSIGTALTRRALAWLDERNAATKVVMAAFGNRSAIEFYRRFGFMEDHITLRQISSRKRRRPRSK